MSIPFTTWTQDEKRTIKEIEETIKSGTKLNYGCINMPLISLELDHVIPDELHMLLRITDVLIQNLINAATSNDRNKSSIAQSKVCYTSLLAYTYGDTVHKVSLLQVLEGPMLCELTEAIQDCGVPFTIRTDKTNKKIEFSSLLGEDRKKLLNELPPKLSYCQPEEFSSKVKKLWKVRCMYTSG